MTKTAPYPPFSKFTVPSERHPRPQMATAQDVVSVMDKAWGRRNPRGSMTGSRKAPSGIRKSEPSKDTKEKAP